ncbi:MAG: redoxin domain-containing protein [Planctomycetia bacterium]|nr:redoxin domain-containing protein [Planctomycetia bacterium]
MSQSRWVAAFAVFSCFLQAPATGRSETTMAPFTLTALDGTSVAVPAAMDGEFTVVCFLGTECPLARLYAPKLNELAEAFAPRNVRFVGIDSNCQDSAEDLQTFRDEFQLTIPVAKDAENVIADAFRAERMSEVFVLDSAMQVRYHGRIDDRYRPGVSRTVTNVRNDLRIALEELLAGNPVSVPETDMTGCLIGRVKQQQADAKYTYCRDVARILQRNCVECHQEGEIGPFALTDYEEVVGWADMMVEVVDNGRMPPWHASPEHGAFANARTMSEADKQVLRDWVAAGAPYGDAAELPAALPPAKAWNLDREPDLVVAMRDRPFVVPAEGTVEYQYFVVDPKLTEDKWMTGAQVVPGSHAVVHHCIVFLRPPDSEEFRGVSWLAAYVPGQRATMLPPGHGRRVPAGSQLVFQMHYTPNGKEQEDLTRIGLSFGNGAEITHEVYSQIGLDQEFEIPPGEANFSVTASPRHLPANGTLLAVAPHMHVRGKSFRLVSHQGDARTILLDVPHYDFNWQHVYAFAKPLPIASLGKLEFCATFDNSAGNPVNPDPKQHVYWGDQTWEEMAVAFFEVAVPRSATAPTPSTVDDAAAQVAQRREKAGQHADRFMKKFDANGDGLVDRHELPLATERFGDWSLNENADGSLTREDIFRAAMQRDL